MPVKIDWKFEKAVATDRILAQLETHFHVSFPEAYKQLVKQHNGARPRPNVIKTTAGKERVIKTFLTVHPTKGGIKDVSEWLYGQLPDDLLAFASDPFGNYFCFHFRTPETEPSISFWHHETQHGEVVADSFREFLGKLF
ncbi:SMI1/KNR4 family protein [Anaerobacillus sp. CMMVII]|uniref:SMI1/KNR4 family protein n=1 Tax=Anaerobacillus sp. CMMVII TaxID=2755588 RepID=UPI0021B81ED7|nr:SMI1/KNR4 family protein [Anaerobacillus sp. CMMVII]MCT8137670.1 SMI1/KNR4 family protein [Anaerobacillus sp. CMMVII]